MDKKLRTGIENIRSTDRAAQNKAFQELMAATDKPVVWAYDVWDELLADLRDKDNHVRAIAAQVLCNLAKSDPNGRMLKDFDKLLAVTKDERFVTARHCMQSLWKVGVAGAKQQKKYIDGLSRRFAECSAEKNCTLIRYDILQSLRNVYDVVNDVKIRTRAEALIATEDDAKYQKKYWTLWRKQMRKG
jgi:hypothetical protein